MDQLPGRVLASVVALAGDAVITVDASQHIVIFNHAAERLFGRTAAEMLGGALTPLLPGFVHETHRDHVRLFAEGGEQVRMMGDRAVIAGVRANGSEFPAEATISRQDVLGQVFVTAIVRDVSDAKQREQTLQVALEEKGILLAELRHRISNTLQVIQSLVQLQIKRVQNQTVHHELEDLLARVQALHLMYREIQGLGDRVQAAGYIMSMVAHLRMVFTARRDGVAIEADVGEDIMMPAKQATYVGLIIHEIVTNSLKHAFPDDQKGKVRIAFCRTPAGAMELMVEDDGVGWTDGVAPSGTGLGLRLIDRMAASLGARMDVERADGTRYSLEWA
jgi:PAS domain S-box-containing protein